MNDDGRPKQRELSPKLQALLHSDPEHIYSDKELNAIEAIDLELALRIDRSQTLARQSAEDQATDVPVDLETVKVAIDEARCILKQDGGDIEFIALEKRVVRVRFKGTCAGCPRSALDLKTVVERLVRKRAPGVIRVENAF